MALISRVGQGVLGRARNWARSAWTPRTHIPASSWLMWQLTVLCAINLTYAQEVAPAGIPDPTQTSQLSSVAATVPATPATLLISTDPPAVVGPAAASSESTSSASSSIRVDRPRQRSKALAARMEAKLQAQLRSGRAHAAEGDYSDTGSMAVNPIYQTILDKHNTYRSWHQVGSLAWNDVLASQAASYAAQCYFAHDPNANAGENLFATTDTGSQSSALSQAIDNWYNEVSSYNFNSPGWYPSAGHFTQVVWKSTTTVGCAVATCSNGLRGQSFSWAKGTYVVCRYSPAGNVIGQFQTNVFPRSSTPPANPPPNPTPAPQPPPAPTPTPTPTPTPQPPPAFPPATLPAGYKYQSPGCLYSSNSRFRLCMQSDGRVVLYDAGKAWYPGQVLTPTATWATKAPSPTNAPYKLTMQADGNLVASDVAGNVAWWTGAPNKGTPPYKMVVQDNGNVVVSDSLNQAMWATNTARG